jgi:MFS family permease
VSAETAAETTGVATGGAGGQPGDTPGGQTRWRRISTVTLIVLCQSSQSLAYVGMALFLPLIRTELGLSFSQAGLFAVASTATYAVMQIPSGFLADRLGARRVYVVGVLGVNLVSLGIATLPTFALLLVAQAVCGVFRALMFAPGMLLMTREFRPDRRATAMGLFVAFGFSSNIFLNILGPILVESLGWRTLFAIFAGMGMVFLALYLTVGAKTPDTPRSNGVSWGALLRIMRSRILWLCGGIQFVRLSLTMVSTAWWPTYLVVEKGMSLTTAGAVLALGAVLTAPANFLGGYVSDRWGRPLTVIVSSLLVVSSTLVVIVHVYSLAVLLVAVSLNQFFLQIYFGPLFEIPIKAIGAEFAGSISGFSNMWANIGALTSIYLFGALKDHFHTFDIGIYGLVGLCGISLVLVTVVYREMRRGNE